MDKKRAILLKNFGGDFTQLNPEMIMKIEHSMYDYAVGQIIEYDSKKIQGDVKSFIWLMFHANRDNIILYMRYRLYKLAVRKAKFRSKAEGYKMYVVLKSNIKYQVISTLDFKFNKSIRVFDKNLSALDMEKVAALVIYPDGSSTGPGFSGHDTDRMAKQQRNKSKGNNHPGRITK